ALAAGGLSTFAAGTQAPVRFFTRAGIAVGLFALGLLSWRQSGNYRDVETLYKTTIAGNPSCWMAYNNLGNERMRARRWSAAIGNFRAATRLKPDSAVI